MSTLGDIYELTIDETGKVRVERNEKKRIAKLPKNQQIAMQKSKKQRAVSKAKAQTVKSNV